MLGNFHRLICTSLQIHAQLEEEIFYPAMRGAGTALLNEFEPEHEEIRSLIATLSGMQPADEQYDQTFMELMRTVIHHVADEETMLLPNAEALCGDELGRLGQARGRNGRGHGAREAQHVALRRRCRARRGLSLTEGFQITR